MVGLLEVEVEQMDPEEAEELQGLGEVGAAMGAGQAEEQCLLECFLSRRLLDGRSSYW